MISPRACIAKVAAICELQLHRPAAANDDDDAPAAESASEDEAADAAAADVSAAGA